jgi:hypothetical protein
MQFGKVKIQKQAFGSVNIVDDINGEYFPIDGVFGFNHFVKSVYTDGTEPTAPVDNVLQRLRKIVTIYLDE